jgi:hypothetical protein
LGAGAVISDGSVTLVWGDGENKFRFAIGQFRELQERVNQRRVAIGAPLVGPMGLLASLRAQDAWPDDVRDVLRIGMVGGGMPIKEVNRKLSHHFDNKPPLESMMTAYAALFAGLVGVPDQNAVDEDVKKKTSTPSVQSTSEGSTEQGLH